MKLNKSKNKGKVHPSPSSSSSSSSSSNNNNDPISSLNHLLPTAILTLISVLSLQDREVLAYMITHSLKSSSSSSSTSFSFDSKKPTNSNKKTHKKSTNTHKSPSFDCVCFVCFSNYWNLWNSSPNSKLIDQAIEAFEEHLSKTEKHKKPSKKKEKISVVVASSADVEERDSLSLPEEMVTGLNVEDIKEERENETKNGLVFSSEKMVLSDVEERESEEFPVAGEAEERESGVQQQQQHKGLARKVLPDFIGFFQSRLWNRLWGPNA